MVSELEIKSVKKRIQGHSSRVAKIGSDNEYILEMTQQQPDLGWFPDGVSDSFVAVSS